MPENNSSLYAAFAAKDARFDGRFFVGISSTGIYCRPVCRARQPKKSNCTFYQSAAQAEQAGYRPCLLCRPELAPGSSVTDAASVLAHRAALLLEENCANAQSLDELSVQLGCTARHLRRVFKAEYSVSPVEYLQTCKLLLAKNLLTDTNLSVLEVAMAAGFGSLRRFNDLFKTRYKLSPTALRKCAAQGETQSGNITLLLGYRPPYRFEEIIRFLAARAIPGVELVKNGEYLRTVRLYDAKQNRVDGWIKVSHRPKKNALAVTVSDSLQKVLPQILSKVRYLFDLYCEPETVYEALAPMNSIRPGLVVLGLRLPGSFGSFEMALRAVLGQQITVRAANTLAARLVSMLGAPIDTGIEGLTHVFPGPEDILALNGPIENYLGPLGIIAARARTIYALSNALKNGEINFGICANPEAEIKKLMAIPGIGPWTAHYIAMRTMGWPDAFLETDVGVKKALAPYTSTEILSFAQEWRPWRSYAVINLWNSL